MHRKSRDTDPLIKDGTFFPFFLSNEPGIGVFSILRQGRQAFVLEHRVVILKKILTSIKKNIGMR
jgi:hypothetical protein